MLGTLVLGSVGCREEEQSGAVTVNYSLGFGAGLTCAEASVVTVRVSLGTSYSAEAACDGTGVVALDNVSAQSYPLIVEGISADGVIVYDNGHAPENIEVPGSGTATADITLTSTPAQIQFSFNFLDEAGFPYAPQDTPPVAEINVIALQNTCSRPLLEHLFVYRRLEAVRDVEVPDPEREIIGEDVDCVVIELVDQSGAEFAPTWLPTGTTERFEPPGPGRLITITLRCEERTCFAERTVMAAPSMVDEMMEMEGETDGETE